VGLVDVGMVFILGGLFRALERRFALAR
jgi:hypothetical protein